MKNHIIGTGLAMAALSAAAVQVNGLYGPTNDYSVAAGETLEIADKSGADATLSAALQAKISFWVDASKNLVTDTSGNLVAWLDARETPVADFAAYEARTAWTYPRAITYRSGPYAADYPEVKNDVASFGGKPYVDFGEYHDNKWMLFVDAEGNRKPVELVGFSGYVGFGSTAGFVLCDVENPDMAADPYGSGGENGRAFYHKGEGSGTGLNDAIYASISGIGGESGQNPKCWAETRVDGAVVNPLSARHRRNGWELFSQNGPTKSIRDETPYVTTFFNDCNFKGETFTDRQGGGKIAEIMTFSEVLTQDELAEVEAYLRQKWTGGSTLGKVALAEGATLTVSNGVQTVVKEISGAGDIVKSGVGELKIARGGLLGTGTLKLTGGAVTTFQRREQLPPLKAVAGRRVTVSGSWVADVGVGAANAFTVDGNEVGRNVEIGALEDGVKNVVVSKARLTIRPKALPPAAPEQAPAAANLIQNGSFEVDNIVSRDGAWQAFNDAITGWSTSAFQQPDTGDYGLSRHGSTWINDSTDTVVPDGAKCAFIQSKGVGMTNGISQTVTAPTNGLYRFSAWIRCRNRSAYSNSDIFFVLAVDGSPVLSRRTGPRGEIRLLDGVDRFTNTVSELNFQKIVTEIALDAGDHVLDLLAAVPYNVANSQSDRALGIDDVRLTLVKAGAFVKVPDPGFSSCAMVLPSNSSLGLWTQSNVVTPFWTFSGSAGVTRHESTWYWRSDSAAEDEDQEAFLQTNGNTPLTTLSTAVTMPKAGRVRLSLRYAARSSLRMGGSTRKNGQTLAVTLGGSEVLSAVVTSEEMTRASAEADVAAGAQTLVLSSSKEGSSHDCTTIVDDIRIEYIEDEAGLLRDAGFSDNSAAWTVANVTRDGITLPGVREAVFTGANAATASASQTMAMPADGAYLLRFQSRGIPLSPSGHTGVYHGSTVYTHNLEVYVDGVFQGSVYNADAERHTVEMRLPYMKAGSHTLEFRGAAQQENDTCQSRISCPEIVPLATGAAADWSKTKISLTAGATLNLDFGGTLRSGALTLGGVRVTEGTVDAQSHPTYVTGTGALEVTPRGMTLSFR